MSKLWGGRFAQKSDSLADEFSFSISYDYRLAKYDCLASIAHAKMLGKCKIISQTDSKKLVSGLKKILKQVQTGTFKFDPKEEDVHSNIQTALKKLIGAPADKLHTARSRNDLIVADMKMFCMDHIGQIVEEITDLQKALVACAAKYKDVIIPAYTHLQSAQLILLAHHLLAYVEMLDRDKERLYAAFKHMDEMPLGSGALSGTSLPIDRIFLTKELGFIKPTDNSVDSVSDRDFIIETLSALAIIGMHCSRIAEDQILWATSEFDFIHIDSSLCTGSSIMPHKKNPDMKELIRGESAKLISNLNEVLVLMKGLPLTYNRDMQLDKPPLFESVDKIHLIVPLLTKHFASVKIAKDTLAKRIDDQYFLSVDVMEYLIKKGMSYRQAHDTVGKMTQAFLDKGIKFSDVELKDLQKFSKLFKADIKKNLNPADSVKMKTSHGSTNPKLVEQQIIKWKKVLK